MKRTVTFGAVGDIAFSRTVGRDIAKHGFDWPFAKMLPHLRKADLLCGNMESITLPAEYPDDQIDPAGLVGKLDGTPALQAAAAWMALESISGCTSAFCKVSTDSKSDTGSWRITRLPTWMPSCVVMNISLVALSASATARATPSELTR